METIDQRIAPLQSHSELADLRFKDKRGLQADVCSTVYRYVKGLQGKGKVQQLPKRMNSEKMLEVLKEAGYYKKVNVISTDERKQNPTISVQGHVKVTGKEINTWNKEYVHIEIEKLGVILSAEQLGELINTVVSEEEEKKQLVNTLVNLVKTVGSGEKKEKR